MECRFCGRTFDSDRALHVHQAEAHGEVDKELRTFLDRDANDIIDRGLDSRFSAEEVIDAERKLAARDEVIQYLQDSSVNDLRPEDVDEKLQIIDEIEERIDESLRIQRQRKEMRKKTRRLREEKQEISERIDAQKELEEDERKEIEQLKAREEALEDEVERLQREISDLRREKAVVNSSIHQYREKKKQLAQRIDRLYSKMSNMTLS